MMSNYNLGQWQGFLLLLEINLLTHPSFTCLLHGHIALVAYSHSVID